MKKALLTVLLIGALVTLLMAVPRNKVVVETGTGTWCTYCPGAAMGCDDLVSNGQPVAIVEYHNGDTFTTTESNARISYYNITGFPTAEFDGLNPSVGGSHTASMYSTYLPRVTARYAVPSHFTIAAGGSANGNVYTINVVIDKTEADTNTNLRLHAVVTESDIQFNWQGQTELNFVERLMAPNQNGTTIDFGTGTQVTVPLTFTVNPAWVLANCKLVLFLQNNTSKEILQGTQYSLPEIGGAYPVSATTLSFPDTYVTGTATQNITLTNFWNITATGTITSSNPMFHVGTPSPNFTIQPYQPLTVPISFMPTAAGDQTGTLTITSNFPDYEAITIPMTGHAFLNAAPVASNVTVSGIPVITMVLTGAYDFYDADNNSQGESIYQWLRYTPGVTEPAVIANATANTYHLTQEDVGNTIAFKVTPVDQYGMPGTPVTSPQSPTIEVLPAPQNLTFEVQGGQNVVLHWQRPNHFNTRDLAGYRVYRNDLIVQTIPNANTLTFTDAYLSDGDYSYWVVSIFSGTPVTFSEPSNVVNVHIGQAIDDPTNAITQMNVYPNPFSANAHVMLTAKANSPVCANVFNSKGQLVTTLKGTTDSNGTADLSLTQSQGMENGIYFVTVKSANSTITRKVVLMK